MPTYEYACEKCGHQFEKFQPMAAKPLTVCPKDLCARKHWGKGKLKKMISVGAGLIFKGSGFYITDYRSEGYKSAAKQDSAAAQPKTETKTDTKPAVAPKAESKTASKKD